MLGERLTILIFLLFSALIASGLWILKNIHTMKKQKQHSALVIENMKQQLSHQIEEVQFHRKAKEALLSSLSHELRTPLNAIVGLNHILEESELSDRQKEIVSKIQSSSDHLTSLLNDILDFSMLKSEKLTLNPSQIGRAHV